MHILITRPLEDCSEMILKFQSLGHQVSHLPLLSIEKMSYEQVNFLDYGGIIFTSANSIKFLEAKKIDKNEGQIDWGVGASKIIGKINGLFPYPGAFFNFNGERYKILKAEIGNGMGNAGEVVSDNLEVACGNNQSIKILEIQKQGKNPQKINEFILGSKIKKGSIISNV